MRDKDLISSVFFLLFSLVITIESIHIGIGTAKNPGIGFFPFCQGFILFLLSVWLLVCVLLRKRKPTDKIEDLSFHWQNIIMVTISILLYSYLLEYLGYLLATFILMGFLFSSIERKSWRSVLIATVCSSGISFLLFDILLKVELPKGTLFLDLLGW